jgi:uncharacterized protein YPO0396
LSDGSYPELVALAQSEHELVLRSDFEALERLSARRDALIATLPATAPASARPALTEAARIQALTTAILEEARTRLSAEFVALDRGRQTAAGYGRASGTVPHRGTITVAA